LREDKGSFLRIMEQRVRKWRKRRFMARGNRREGN